MTDLLDVQAMARWIQRDGAENILRGMAGYVEDDYRRWERFDKTPRVASHTPFGVIELMPTSDGELYSFKFVNGHPMNPARGFQTVTAFGALADVDNGYPIFLAEMTLLTALRTAATSAMAAKHLARPDARVSAMIGSGSQSEFQALAFRAVLGIEDLRIFDVDPAAMEKMRRNLEPLGFRIHHAASAGEAVEGRTSSPPARPTNNSRPSSPRTWSRRACTSTRSAVIVRARPSSPPGSLTSALSSSSSPRRPASRGRFSRSQLTSR